MPDRLLTPDNDRLDRSYLASLASARYVLLTTFPRKGTPVSAPVRAVVDGDRAYFHAWSHSGSVRRLRHTSLVQVAPCSALGMYSSGPAFYATARLLPDDEAGQVAGELARKYPVRHRYLIPLLHRTRRWTMVHYELLAHDARARELPGLQPDAAAHGGRRATGSATTSPAVTTGLR